MYHAYSAKQQPEHRMICNLYCYNDNVDLCDIREIFHSILESNKSSTELPFLAKEMVNMNRMNWRLLPLIDPLVDRWMSRDTDSEVGERESAAVHQWLDSDQTFHVMRDHPAHSHPIMGGDNILAFSSRWQVNRFECFKECSEPKCFNIGIFCKC